MSGSDSDHHPRVRQHRGHVRAPERGELSLAMGEYAEWVQYRHLHVHVLYLLLLLQDRDDGRRAVGVLLR